ncbi:hypothetical protein BC643_4699 [Mangrovibacterium diazotrophicum]|uniref:Uncharacterized protein n=1 Tax=Mangrovibacterium diazotrophicum TaxID=1261403 RepID=A0A419VUI0_9BACT|nr:hypothetical protein BC643_4699 [Mangrovibacterium diazotrophicum]
MSVFGDERLKVFNKKLKIKSQYFSVLYFRFMSLPIRGFV